MAAKKKTTIAEDIINSDKTTEEKVDELHVAWLENKLGVEHLNELQNVLGEYYAPFVRKVHLGK